MVNEQMWDEDAMEISRSEEIINEEEEIKYNEEANIKSNSDGVINSSERNEQMRNEDATEISPSVTIIKGIFQPWRKRNHTFF